MDASFFYQDVLCALRKRNVGGLNPSITDTFKFSDNIRVLGNALTCNGVQLEVSNDLPTGLTFSFKPFSTGTSNSLGSLFVRQEYLNNSLDVVNNDSMLLSSIFGFYKYYLDIHDVNILFTDDNMSVVDKVTNDIKCTLPIRITKILDYLMHGPRFEITDPSKLEQSLRLFQNSRIRECVSDATTPLKIYLELLHQLAEGFTMYDPLFSLSPSSKAAIVGLVEPDNLELQSSLTPISDVLPVIRDMCLCVYGVDQFESIETYVGYDSDRLPLEQNLSGDRVDSLRYYAITMNNFSLCPANLIPLNIGHQADLMIQQLPCYALINFLNSNTGLSSVSTDQNGNPNGEAYCNSDGSKFYPKIFPRLYVSNSDISVSLKVIEQDSRHPFGSAVMGIGLSHKDMKLLLRNNDLNSALPLLRNLNRSVISCLYQDERISRAGVTLPVLQQMLNIKL